MQVSSFMGIQTALKGLLAQQRGLDVTSHNVANANTLGYSRQEATMAASNALTIQSGALQGGGGAQMGTGVDVNSYRRIRETFLDVQYRIQNTSVGYNAATSAALTQAEQSFDEPSATGLASQTGKLWSSWGDLANSPAGSASLAAKQAVLEQAKTVAASYKALDGQLAQISTGAATEYAGLTAANGDVKAYADQIGALNTQIAGAIQTGAQPNDLLDQRDMLLDKLSALAQTSVENNADGTVKVSFGDAANPLVDGAAVSWPQTLTNPGGKLGGLLSLSQAGGTIDSLRGDLNSAAKALADSVNAAHTAGGGPPFFSYTAGNEAGSLAVAANVSTIQTTTGSASGGQDIARAIAALRDGAADSTYGALVTRIGADSRDATNRTTSAQSLVDSVSDRRDSVSGVSLDEEMTNLMKFQRGYQASSRALSTLDEALDVLINRTGRVGL